MNKNNTIFCDIDGTIFKYRKFESYETTKPDLLDGAVEKMKAWKQEGHMIILTTARPEYLRDHTISELTESGVHYDRLIMGIERGPRFLVNDMDPAKPGERAMGINLLRDSGLSSIFWDQWDRM